MNQQLQSFEEFLASQSVQLPIWAFVINLLLAAVLGLVLGWVYTRYGTSLSNRRQFAGNFMLLAMTTMLIITIVKSSIALSLGLVGALSIVRFRAAIKEPEELVYLFLTIGIGLGLGADQRLVTIMAFALITGLIWLKHQTTKKQDTQNLYLTIGSNGQQQVELNSVVSVLKRHCTDVDLKRFDESKDRMEVSFLVTFESYSDLEASRSELRRLNDSINIAFLDNRGVGRLQ